MNFFDSDISEEAIFEVEKVLRTGYVSEGKLVKQFESRLAGQLGLSHPVALNSGTSALHLGLVLAGVSDGDEVILPAQTFIATGMAILMQRAKPVFVDIDSNTGNIDPSAIRRNLTSRTRAIIPVHWGGYPCDLDEINEIANDAGVNVIEDAAHALGATYRGRPIGSISRFTAFSFQAIKHLTTGDGGALSCLHESDEQNAFVKRWFSIDRLNSKPSILGEREYDAQSIGFKYHMNNISAALGLGNLQHFHDVLTRHQEIAAHYRKELSSVAGLTLLTREDDRTSSDWFFPFLVERREDFIRKLISRDCTASVVHLRIDRNAVFGSFQAELPGQDIFDERQCALPVHQNLSDDDVYKIIETVKDGW